MWLKSGGRSRDGLRCCGCRAKRKMRQRARCAGKALCHHVMQSGCKLIFSHTGGVGIGCVGYIAYVSLGAARRCNKADGFVRGAGPWTHPGGTNGPLNRNGGRASERTPFWGNRALLNVEREQRNPQRPTSITRRHPDKPMAPAVFGRLAGWGHGGQRRLGVASLICQPWSSLVHHCCL